MFDFFKFGVSILVFKLIVLLFVYLKEIRMLNWFKLFFIFKVRLVIYLVVIVIVIVFIVVWINIGCLLGSSFLSEVLFEGFDGINVIIDL